MSTDLDRTVSYEVRGTQQPAIIETTKQQVRQSQFYYCFVSVGFLSYVHKNA